MSGCRNARGPVHVHADIAVAVTHRRPGVHPDAHPQWFSTRPLTGQKVSLRLHRRAHRRWGVGEHDEEGVTSVPSSVPPYCDHACRKIDR
jgi:hypothetical protein